MFHHLDTLDHAVSSIKPPDENPNFVFMPDAFHDKNPFNIYILDVFHVEAFFLSFSFP
jgi:hypothetical protein